MRVELSRFPTVSDFLVNFDLQKLPFRRLQGLRAGRLRMPLNRNAADKFRSVGFTRTAAISSKTLYIVNSCILAMGSPCGARSLARINWFGYNCPWPSAKKMPLCSSSFPGDQKSSGLPETFASFWSWPCLLHFRGALCWIPSFWTSPGLLRPSPNDLRTRPRSTGDSPELLEPSDQGKNL